MMNLRIPSDSHQNLLCLLADILQVLIAHRLHFPARFGKQGEDMKCCVCNNEITFGSYLFDSFGNAAHRHHLIEHCPACDRIIGQNSSQGKVSYSDGRFLCGHCYKFENPVQETKQIEQAYFYAQKLLTEKGFYFPKKIKISLVSRDVFAEAGYPNSVMGLNTSQISLFEQKHQIKILFGLPSVMSSGIIAHELLHVWQHSKGLYPEKTVCEGLCELGAGLVYKRTKTQLGQHLFESLEKNMIAVYSDGFKTMRHLLETNGWQSVRDFVKDNSNKQSSIHI